MFPTLWNLEYLITFRTFTVSDISLLTPFEAKAYIVQVKDNAQLLNTDYISLQSLLQHSETRHGRE